jgi:hypothetical protein
MPPFLTASEKGMEVARDLTAVSRLRGLGIHDVMLDPQRLAWDMSAVRAERARREIKADLIITSTEGGEFEVIVRLLREMFVDGLSG